MKFRIAEAKGATPCYAKMMFVESVNDQYSVDFKEGGHWLACNYIPKNEVWLNNEIEPTDRKYILARELFEIGQMSQGIDYDIAHAKASKYEQKLRKENGKNTK
jgi:hypothetical protein